MFTCSSQCFITPVSLLYGHLFTCTWCITLSIVIILIIIWTLVYLYLVHYSQYCYYIDYYMDTCLLVPHDVLLRSIVIILIIMWTLVYLFFTMFYYTSIVIIWTLVYLYLVHYSQYCYYIDYYMDTCLLVPHDVLLRSIVIILIIIWTLVYLFFTMFYYTSIVIIWTLVYLYLVHYSQYCYYIDYYMDTCLLVPCALLSVLLLY